MSRRGFTLIEMAVTVAIAGIIAAVGIASMRSMGKNAAVGDAAQEIAAELEGLRVVSMREGVPYGALLLDVVGNDPDKCNKERRDCLRFCTVRDPPATWTAATSSPATAPLMDCTVFTGGVRFQLAAPRKPPPPFDALVANPTDLVPAVDGRRVLALRFETNGIVTPAVENPGMPTGVAVVVSSDATAAAVNRGVVLSFPYGLVRTYSY